METNPSAFILTVQINGLRDRCCKYTTGRQIEREFGLKGWEPGEEDGGSNGGMEGSARFIHA